MPEVSVDPLLTVVALFERNIGNGAWLPGTKLPTERELEEEFGVPRNKLRKILKRLEADGKITRHVGRGSFVTGLSPASSVMLKARSAALADSSYAALREEDFTEAALRLQDASPDDIMEVRMIVEPAAAELAAIRATPADLIVIEQCNETSKKAESMKEFEYWDGQLHLEIVRAAKNELLSSLYDGIDKARLLPNWQKMKHRDVSAGSWQHCRDDHSALVAAILDRDPERAREVAVHHLLSVRRNFFGEAQ